jgi:hypothetical protein
MEEWGNMSQVFIGNVGARLAERLDDSGNLERVPYQAQAARFVHDLLVIGVTGVMERNPELGIRFVMSSLS